MVVEKKLAQRELQPEVEKMHNPPAKGIKFFFFVVNRCLTFAFSTQTQGQGTQTENGTAHSAIQTQLKLLLAH